MDFWHSIFICSFFYIAFHRYSTLDSFVKFVSLQWVLVLTLYKSSEVFFVPLTQYFYNQFIMFYLSLLVFYSFFYIAFKNNRIKPIKPIFSYKVMYFVSILFSIFSFFLFIYYFYKYGDFYTFRQVVINDNLSLYVGYSFPLVAASYVHSESNNKPIRFFFIFLMVSLTLVSSSKIFLVLTVIFISSIYKYNYKISFKKIILLLILGFTLFAVMHIAMDKVAGTNDFPLAVALAYTFLGYFLGGIAAFEMIVSGFFSTGYKYSSLIDILLNLPSVAPVDSESGWVLTGMWFGNVYSGFANWYEYSPEYGVVIYGFIISLVHAFINTHVKDNLAIQYLKGFSLYCLLFIVFYDTYVMSIKLWLAFSLATVFLAIANNKI